MAGVLVVVPEKSIAVQGAVIGRGFRWRACQLLAYSVKVQASALKACDFADVL